MSKPVPNSHFDEFAINNGLTVGMDGEVFFASPAGRLRSAIGLVGGTKDYPKQIPECEGAVQEDNVMAEINIDPASTAEDFSRRIGMMLSYVTNVAARHKMVISNRASGKFTEASLSHPSARVFGCDPAFSVYTYSILPPPALSEDGSLVRTCGGHVHVGGEHLFAPDPEIKMDMIRAMDVYLGLPSLILDADKIRNKHYGIPGSYRPKPYGFEYRKLSNYWMHSDVLRKWVFDMTIKSAIMALKHRDYIRGTQKQVLEIFKRNEFDHARSLFLAQGGEFPKGVSI